MSTLSGSTSRDPAFLADREATLIAIPDLLANVVRYSILGEVQHPVRNDHHDHHNDRDLNLKAAYLYLVADAATLMRFVGTMMAASCARGLILEVVRLFLDRK